MAVCDNCHAFKTHGKKCWYYWEDKRMCSQFKQNQEGDARVVSEEHIKE